MYIHAVAGLFVQDTYMLSRNKLNDAIPIFETRRQIATKTAFNAAICCAQNFEKISYFSHTILLRGVQRQPRRRKMRHENARGGKNKEVGGGNYTFCYSEKISALNVLMFLPICSQPRLL